MTVKEITEHFYVDGDRYFWANHAAGQIYKWFLKQHPQKKEK